MGVFWTSDQFRNFSVRVFGITNNEIPPKIAITAVSRYESSPAQTGAANIKNKTNSKIPNETFCSVVVFPIFSFSAVIIVLIRASSICSFLTLLVKNNIDINNIVIASGAPTEDQLPKVIVLAKRSFTISAYIRFGGDAIRVVTLPIDEEKAIPSKSVILNPLLNLIPLSDRDDKIAKAIGIIKIANCRYS